MADDINPRIRADPGREEQRNGILEIFMNGRPFMPASPAPSSTFMTLNKANDIAEEGIPRKKI